MNDKKNNNYISDELIKNGLDFLNFSIENLNQKKYKYSIIFFAMAIEVLLKAILAEKDLSNISKTKNPSPEKIMTGDVQTISASQLEDKFKEVYSLELLPYELEKLFKTYKEITKQRNKAVHCFSLDLNLNEQKNNEETVEDDWVTTYADCESSTSKEINKDNQAISTELNKILDEQWKCWHALYCFLSDQPPFKKYKGDLNTIKNKIAENDQYSEMLKHKYDLVTPDLAAWSKNDENKIINCLNCQYGKKTVCIDKNQEIKKYADGIEFNFSYDVCLMCDSISDNVQSLTIKCKECQYSNIFGTLNDLNCENCQEDININALDESINGCGHFRSKDSEMVKLPEHCFNCGCDNTVIYLYDKDTYFCTNCFILDSEYIQCNECWKVFHENDCSDIYRYSWQDSEGNDYLGDINGDICRCDDCYEPEDYIY